MRVSQCRFSSLTRHQKEALLLILSALDDTEFAAIHNAAHGEVTLEWTAAETHPVLQQLPEAVRVGPSPSAAAGAAQARQWSSVTKQTSAQDEAHSASVAAQRRSSPTAVLRDPQSTRDKSPGGRKASPLAASARKGAAARTRSLSPVVSSPRGRVASPATKAHERPADSVRSVQWAARLVDEVLTAARKLKIDRNRITNVEELSHHILAARFGVTPAHKKLFGELSAAAHVYSEISPLCLIFHSYASSRSSSDLTEFVQLSKITGALVPWSSTESVKTAPRTASALPPRRPDGYRDPSLSSCVSLRRYVAHADLPLALRDALKSVVPRGSFLHSEVRRGIQQWLRNPQQNPPIAFDFRGHVDADVLALMMIESMRDAKRRIPKEPQWGLFTAIERDDDDDEDGAEGPVEDQVTIVDDVREAARLHAQRDAMQPATAQPQGSATEHEERIEKATVLRQRAANTRPPSRPLPEVASVHPQRYFSSQFSPAPAGKRYGHAAAGAPVVVTLPQRSAVSPKRHAARVSDSDLHAEDISARELLERRDAAVRKALAEHGVAVSTSARYSVNCSQDAEETHTGGSHLSLGEIADLANFGSPLEPQRAADDVGVSDMRATLAAIDEELQRRRQPALSEEPSRQQHIPVAARRYHDPLNEMDLGDDERLLLEQLELSLRARGAPQSKTFSPRRPLEEVARRRQ